MPGAQQVLLQHFWLFGQQVLRPHGDSSTAQVLQVLVSEQTDPSPQQSPLQQRLPLGQQLPPQSLVLEPPTQHLVTPPPVAITFEVLQHLPLTSWVRDPAGQHLRRPVESVAITDVAEQHLPFTISDFEPAGQQPLIVGVTGSCAQTRPGAQHPSKHAIGLVEGQQHGASVSSHPMTAAQTSLLRQQRAATPGVPQTEADGQHFFGFPGAGLRQTSPASQSLRRAQASPRAASEWPAPMSPARPEKTAAAMSFSAWRRLVLVAKERVTSSKPCASIEPSLTHLLERQVSRGVGSGKSRDRAQQREKPRFCL